MPVGSATAVARTATTEGTVTADTVCEVNIYIYVYLSFSPIFGIAIVVGSLLHSLHVTE